MLESLVALTTLTAMEIVLGIDNVIFIAIVAGRLPKEQQPKARQVGLGVALITRLMLLFLLFYLNQLDKTVLLDLTWLGGIINYFDPTGDWFDEHKKSFVVTVKELVLLLGGSFLIAKATLEIHHKLEGVDEEVKTKSASSFNAIIFQIALIDIVFSLDSVITAVGMARAIWVMVVAMILAVGVMIVFAGRISDFVHRHPTIKILALSFLILIGVMLVVESFEEHALPKGYIYFAMAFSLVVEVLNMRVRAQATPVDLHEKQMPAT